LTYKVTATAPSRATTGETIKVTNQEVVVTVPETLVTTLKGLLGTSFDSEATVSIGASNTDPASRTSPPITATVAVPATGDLVTTLHPADASFKVTGGDAAFKMTAATTKVTVQGQPVTLNCVPTTADKLFTVVVTGPPVSTTTTTTATTIRGTSTTVVGAGGVTTTTAASGNSGTQVLGTQLARTGVNGPVLWAQILTGLLLFELGLLVWAWGEWLFNRRVVR
jgi:hypothetical protein